MNTVKPLVSVLNNTRTRFLTMMVSLLVLFIVYPFLGTFSLMSILTDIFFTLILLSGVFALSEHKKLRIFSVLLACITIALSWLNNLTSNQHLILITVFLYLVFFSTVAMSILLHVFKTEEVTSEKIYGAVAVYLFIGLIWALLYGLIELLVPGSFASTLAPGVLSTGEDVSHPLLYYSLVSLTTLGYGDIVPITPAARVLSSLEAVIGQLYLTVLIARLIGLHIAYGQKRKSAESQNR